MRFQTADHLFGLAAECAAKVIFQLSVTTAKRYVDPPKEHINILWPMFWASYSGHTMSRMTGTLPPANAFQRWKVTQRYDCDDAVQMQVMTSHKQAAEKLIKAAEALQIESAGS